MRETKTNKEIYVEKYTCEMLSENPMFCAEAIGYLKALKEYFPREQKWVETETTYLMLELIFHSF